MSEVAQDTRIDAVILEARAAVAREIERHAEVKVTKLAAKGEPKFKKPDNLVMVWFDHGASRMGDPHRHGHLLIFNLSLDKQEGIRKAVELRYLDMPRLSKIATDTMRKGLHELGYKTKAVGREFEIVGVPAEVKGEFSQRHNQIKGIQEDMEAKIGKSMSSKAKGKLSLYERPDKQYFPFAERHKDWVSRITEELFKVLKALVKAAKDAVALAAWSAGLNQPLAISRDSGTHSIERDDRAR